MNDFKESLKQLLTSKKSLAAIVGVLMVAAQKTGVIIDEDTLYQLLAVIGTYILGQGIADAGKEAAQVKVDNVPSEAVPEVPKDVREIQQLMKDFPRLIPFVSKSLKEKMAEINEANRKILGEPEESSSSGEKHR